MHIIITDNIFHTNIFKFCFPVFFTVDQRKTTTSCRENQKTIAVTLDQNNIILLYRLLFNRDRRNQNVTTCNDSENVYGSGVTHILFDYSYYISETTDICVAPVSTP